MNYTENVKTKSLGLAIVLSLIFGPIGLFYASVSGGLIMSLTPLAVFLLLFLGVISQSSVLLASSAILLVIFALSYWIICVIWAATSVSNYNNKVINDARHEEFLRILDEKNQINNSQIVQNTTPEETTKVPDKQNIDQPTIKVWKQQNPNSSTNEYYEIYGTPQSTIITPTYTYEETNSSEEKSNSLFLYIALTIILIISVILFVYVTKLKDEYQIEGKKIYVLIPTSLSMQIVGKPTSFINSVYELELNFLNNTEVEVTLIVCYDCDRSDKSRSVVKTKYDYIYSEGNLQIPSLEINTTFLEKDSMLICSDNTIFYKYSISQLNELSKKDRMNKLLNYPKTKKLNKFLSHEIIVTNL